MTSAAPGKTRSPAVIAACYRKGNRLRAVKSWVRTCRRERNPAAEAEATLP